MKSLIVLMIIGLVCVTFASVEGIIRRQNGKTEDEILQAVKDDYARRGKQFPKVTFPKSSQQTREIGDKSFDAVDNMLERIFDEIGKLETRVINLEGGKRQTRGNDEQKFLATEGKIGEIFAELEDLSQRVGRLENSKK